MGLISSIVQALLGRTVLRDVLALHEMTKDPRRHQRELLFAQLRREASTAFGRDHGFSEINSIEEYRRRLPIANYDYFAPYIERVKAGETEALFHQQKVLMFALTSGTSSARKFIPVTERFLQDYRRMWSGWGLLAFGDHRSAFRQAKLTFASDDDEFRTSSGIPCGSISGLTVQMQHWLVRKSYVLPPAAAKLKEIQAKYYLAWRLGLTRDMGMWVSPNPSTLLNLARFGDRYRESLIRDIHQGTLTDEFTWPAAIREALRLRPDRRRAAELTRIVDREGVLRPRDAWPQLKLIGCWTGGSMAAYLRNFPEYFGDVAIRDLGLIASEARMTLPIADGTPAGVLEISSSYFEFVPAREIDSPNPTVLEAHELQEGKDYFILLTTSGGLYRYNIYDVVRCVGFHERTPKLEFLNKGSQISNVTGEKLTEHQVSTSVAAALAQQQCRLRTYSLAPCWDEELPYYGLFVEAGDLPEGPIETALAARVEQELCAANLEYATKRETARLGPVAIIRLPSGTWEQWDRQRLQRNGGTAEQYKHPALITDLEFHRSIPTLSYSAR